MPPVLWIWKALAEVELTWKSAVGAAVPIPTLPVLVTCRPTLWMRYEVPAATVIAGVTVKLVSELTAVMVAVTGVVEAEPFAKTILLPMRMPALDHNVLAPVTVVLDTPPVPAVPALYCTGDTESGLSGKVVPIPTLTAFAPWPPSTKLLFC